jgi:hypothetical protein
VKHGAVVGQWRDYAGIAAAIPLAAARLAAALAKRPRTTLGAEAESVAKNAEFGSDSHPSSSEGSVKSLMVAE